MRNRVTPCFGDPKLKGKRFGPALVLVASLAAIVATSGLAVAASSRNERPIASIESRTAGEPIMAIVSLRSQQITVYDSQGWILRAPISSGQKGRETPAGIFSVVQKDAAHHSNLYDDAYMPHMQRLTWSGIALHGGPLPGHPASHGCVRMPYDFAERLFEVTKLGMRVIVAPNDVAPVSIAHPSLLQPKPEAEAAAAVRAAEAQEAAGRAERARLAALAASRELAQTRLPVRATRNLKLRAEAQLAAAERAVDSAASAEAKEQAEQAKAEAATRVAEFEVQLAAAEAELQPKLDAVAHEREAAVAAEAEDAEAARKAAGNLEPVSVFISRKAQRLYVRQAFQPVLEAPIAIRDPDLAVGMHVFTALERSGANGEMLWSVVSLRHSDVVTEDSRSSEGRAEAKRADFPEDAKAALDRIIIPQETIDQIAGMVSPRSSLIISDEGLSSETGRGTEFVIIMSGEPQGGLSIRRRQPAFGAWYEPRGDRFLYWRPRLPSPYSYW
jgi:hypothetical protein